MTAREKNNLIALFCVAAGFLATCSCGIFYFFLQEIGYAIGCVFGMILMGFSLFVGEN